MKTLIFGLALFISSLGFATELTIEDRAQLATLKMMLEIQEEQIAEVTQEVKTNAVAMSDLGAFSFGEKRQLKAKNCGDIKSVVGANLMMVAVSLEQSKKALSKIEITDEDGKTFQDNFLAYIKGAKAASESCKDVKKSAAQISKAAQSLYTATDILVAVLPELIEN